MNRKDKSIIVKTCSCGKTFISDTTYRKYCDACRRSHRLAVRKRARIRQRENPERGRDRRNRERQEQKKIVATMPERLKNRVLDHDLILAALRRA